MPVVGNRLYNDPSLGAAFSNLAGMFAPPSGADLSGYATANAKKAEAERLAALFEMAQSPDFNQTTFDRMGIATGNYNPTQSYYAQDQNNATALRGQDVTAATTLEGKRIENQGALERLFATPVVAKDGDTVYLPDQTAAATGLDPVLSGTTTLAQGETAILPGGKALTGAPKPLTESELKATILAGLPANEQRVAALASANVEPVMSADGKTVENVFRPDSVGRIPAPPASTAAPETQNWQSQDGAQRGTAVFDRAKGWVDTQTGQPIPPGSITFNSSLEGGGADTGLGPSPANITAGRNLNAALDSAEFTANQVLGILAQNVNAAGVPARIVGGVQSLTSSLAQTAKAFANEAPDAAVTMDNVRGMLTSVASGYDPDIVRVQAAIMDLAYLRAQINNPTGEVSRQAFERALEQFGQGLFSSQTDLTTALKAFLSDTIASGRVRASSLLGKPPADTAPVPASVGGVPPGPAVGTIEDGYRFKGGAPDDPANWEAAQ